MDKSIEQIIKKSDLYPTPKGLEKKICQKIQNLEQHKARRHFFGFGLFSIVSFAGLVVSFEHLWNNLKTGGVFEYLSVIASNGSYATSMWKEVTFSILESVPIITLSVFLALIIAFIVSSIKAVENINTKLVTA